METKSSDWLRGPSGPTVCRCCFAEGCYKDISTEYFWMGKREVYDEMLNQTFDINISFGRSTGPNSNSRLICEPCISRLRDAAEFKRQVQECERMFMDYLDPGSAAPLGLEATQDAALKDVKVVQVNVVQVKEEKGGSDDGFADRGGFDDDDDDDDDLDDQPLTRLATKVPKKESVDLFDLLDNAKGTKRKSTTKTKTSPAKKAKTKKETPKATTSKPKPEKKKKEKSFDSARNNAEAILTAATAYPFRVADKSILCVYCLELYDDPDIFRQHMDEEHKHFNLKVAFHNLPSLEFIKADIADLKCRICTLKFQTLETIADHLKSEHKQTIDTEGKLGVMPYLLHKNEHICAVCEKNFPTLFHLNRHTVSHFFGNVCHVCGKSYLATTGLLRHIRSKHQEYQVSCKRCRKVFPNMEAKEKHTRTEKSCMPYVCSKCNDRFLDWKSRKRHMESTHGQTKRTFRCPDCDINFNSENSYYEHFKLQHSRECSSCKHCGLKFLFTSRLKRHLAKHNI